jgi:hypothetical protein
MFDFKQSFTYCKQPYITHICVSSVPLLTSPKVYVLFYVTYRMLILKIGINFVKSDTYFELSMHFVEYLNWFIYDCLILNRVSHTVNSHILPIFVHHLYPFWLHLRFMYYSMCNILVFHLPKLKWCNLDCFYYNAPLFTFLQYVKLCLKSNIKKRCLFDLQLMATIKS